MILTKVETQQLVDEFIEFQIAEMTTEDLVSYVKDILRFNINKLNGIDEIKQEIDEYDEYLYEILVNYIQDKPESYQILQEFLHERQEQMYYE